MDDDIVPKIQGGIAVIRGKDVDSMESTSPYYVGKLPPLLAIRWALSNNIWIAALLILVVAILLAGVSYTLLRTQANRRSSGK